MNLDCSHLHHDIIGSPDAEDTAFDAELTRQIMMLINDDDEETNARGRIIKGGSEFQRRSVLVSHGSCGGGLVTSGSYFTWPESTMEVPTWMERLWAGNGGGTGVFIPRVVANSGKFRGRRHNKQRKNKVNYGGITIHG